MLFLVYFSLFALTLSDVARFGPIQYDPDHGLCLGGDCVASLVTATIVPSSSKLYFFQPAPLASFKLAPRGASQPDVFGLAGVLDGFHDPFSARAIVVYNISTPMVIVSVSYHVFIEVTFPAVQYTHKVEAKGNSFAFRWFIDNGTSVILRMASPGQ